MLTYRKSNDKFFVLMRELLSVEYTEMCYIKDARKKILLPERNWEQNPYYLEIRKACIIKPIREW